MEGRSRRGGRRRRGGGGRRRRRIGKGRGRRGRRRMDRILIDKFSVSANGDGGEEGEGGWDGEKTWVEALELVAEEEDDERRRCMLPFLEEIVRI